MAMRLRKVIRPTGTVLQLQFRPFGQFQAGVFTGDPGQQSMQDLNMPMFEVPWEYDQPALRPVVYDQAYPGFGAAGVHWNPTNLPHAYDLYWGAGHYEVPMFDLHDHGHQEGFWKSVENFLAFFGFVFLLYHIHIYFASHVWCSEMKAGHFIYPDHSHYLLRGGDPEAPHYLAQLAKEKELLELGIRIAKGEATDPAA
jgi:hypothetical protein|eukprot:CAMPEP_0174286212 /NCGR_PEP_ID=MMETSP0809-20121228/10926_1 /TAXON_ID=73025 ORGANISM="Eutreptiella gymnastica-like, Strain CCMP1594" /NCGR_SAMPLE_ID=MMETSP0809 /ASSEMBLY_ACC=CAM_ASM_000658 /LENGTH=197 /DNA_ID=CAMNT_0015382191 /DNA_START=15 /DNA_END=608 /DNA_ORIENTATION=+